MLAVSLSAAFGCKDEVDQQIGELTSKLDRAKNDFIKKAREATDTLLEGKDQAIELTKLYLNIADDVQILKDGGYSPEAIAGFLDDNIHPSVREGIAKYLGIAKEEPVAPVDTLKLEASCSSGDMKKAIEEIIRRLHAPADGSVC